MPERGEGILGLHPPISLLRNTMRIVMLEKNVRKWLMKMCWIKLQIFRLNLDPTWTTQLNRPIKYSAEPALWYVHRLTKCQNLKTQISYV